MVIAELKRVTPEVSASPRWEDVFGLPPESRITATKGRTNLHRECVYSFQVDKTNDTPGVSRLGYNEWGEFEEIDLDLDDEGLLSISCRRRGLIWYITRTEYTREHLICAANLGELVSINLEGRRHMLEVVPSYTQVNRTYGISISPASHDASAGISFSYVFPQRLDPFLLVRVSTLA